MTSTLPSFAPGTLVTARGREWVVLPPDDDPDTLLLRPLGGTDDDVAGLYLPLEGQGVRHATLSRPDPRYVGDAVSASLLRDAVRFGFRASAGPLRSLGRLAFEPRPYQAVPLLMALRQDPIRLLIGDDVGIGKTIECGLIVRELIDRGEIASFTVLCPPHLCEQWQTELRDKFHLDAVVVRPGTVNALERAIERDNPTDLSSTLFDAYPYTVISIDYIKSDRRRASFIRACPELVIVDEAHGVAKATGRGTGQQQRYALIAELAKNAERHLVFATATPHSGNQDAFASLVGLLVPELRQTVADMEFGTGTQARQKLAQHFVQRRRADIRHFGSSATDFPERFLQERTYKLSLPYRDHMKRVLAYAREIIQDAKGSSQARQRTTWWAALALLRCVSSSPAAAAAALRSRATVPEDGGAAAADRLNAHVVFDLDQSDEATQDDSTPAVDVFADDDTSEHARLLRFAADADALKGPNDTKLAEAIKIVGDLLKDGFSPIVFARYIATAHYVAEELARRFKGVEVAAVTGELPPEEREARIAELAKAEKRVLVATDCLSEGVNLQQGFNAVVHYDLAWNPTRHEQREGRVDRYGQPRDEVRAVMLYGQDNRVDGVVLEVLIKKAQNIRKTLGVSVPVPVDSNRVLEAIFDRLFERSSTDYQQLELELLDEDNQEVKQLDDAWQSAAEREKRIRTIFAQHAMHPDEVEAELRPALEAIGSNLDVRRFVDEAVTRLTDGNARPMQLPGGKTWEILPSFLPQAVRDRGGLNDKAVLVGFEAALPAGVLSLTRTHPLVEAIASYLLDTALELPGEAKAKRAGAVRTAAVSERTTLLLLRARYLIRETRRSGSRELLAEDALIAAYRGDPETPEWLTSEEAASLARKALPVGNVSPAQASILVQDALAELEQLGPAIDDLVRSRADEVLAAYQRVRSAANIRGSSHAVDPKLPADVLGLYVLLPPPREAR